jgi:hypothetical protein
MEKLITVEAVAVADRHHMATAFTGRRHFKH